MTFSNEGITIRNCKNDFEKLLNMFSGRFTNDNLSLKVRNNLLPQNSQYQFCR